MRYPPEKAQPFLFHQYTQLAKAMGLALVVLMAARFFFIGQHGELVALKRNPLVALEALLLGLRFDLMSLTYLAFAPYLVTSVGFVWPREEVLRSVGWFNRLWCFGGVLALALISWCDLSFYGHFQDHLNLIFVSHLKTDPVNLLLSLHRSTHVLVWGSFFLSFVLVTWWLCGRWFRVSRIDLFYARPMAQEEVALFLTAGIVVLVYLARGNFHRAPLSIDEAYFSEVETANELSINGVIALRRGFKLASKSPFEDKRQLSLRGYQQISDAVADLKSYRQESAPATGWSGLNDLVRSTPPRPEIEELRPHVVVFVTHNMNFHWARQGIPMMQELLEWSKSSLAFERVIAADQNPGKSIEALLTGLPSRPDARPLSEGEFMRTRLSSSVHVPFQRAGYHTRFINAQALGQRSLGSYLSHQGWNQIEGIEQLSAQLNLWSVAEDEREDEHGLFDEHVYSYVLRELKRAQSPQLIVVQLASGRPPFRLPRGYQDRGPIRLPPEQQKLFNRSVKETSHYIRAMDYTSSRFVKFHRELSQEAIGGNTIVALTSDLSHWLGRLASGAPDLRRLSVPLLVHGPASLVPTGTTSRAWGSHVDVFPTLYELVLSDAKYWSFGQSLAGAKGLALSSGQLAVNDSGAFIDDQAYCWSMAGGVEHLERCESQAVTKDLAGAWRASVTLADEYLRSAALGQIGLLP